MKNLIILLFLITKLLSQNLSLQGTVINSETKSPLKDVIIKLNNSLPIAYTDKNGFFKLEKLNPEDELSFSYIGYETKSIKLNSYLSIADNPLLIKLNPVLLPSQTILVSATRGSINSVTAFSQLTKNEIKNDYSIQDIPEFLSQLPSTTFYSESGNNVGYSYINIRGFDQRRISVAINGVPQNDPEDHNVYWVDFPDLLENTDFINVQRGAGLSSIGYPSIGGSINILTSNHSVDPKLVFKSSFGSFNTKKLSATFSSGFIENSFSVFGRVSKITSSGYRNSAWSDFNSFYLSLNKRSDNLVTQFNFYGGPIRDGLVYNGIAKFAIKDKELRKENLSYWEANENEYTYKAVRRPEEVEYFTQPHFELLNEYKFNDNLIFNSNLFYIYGEGYYDYDGSWADTSYFRMTYQNGFITDKNPTNTLIRAYVENNQFGWLPKLSINFNKMELILGSEFRLHKSYHSGKILFANNLPENYPANFNYYEYKGKKDVFNFFIHSKIDINERTKLLLETQLAYFKYRLYDEKFVGTDFSVSKLFINPKAGINYRFNENVSSFLSFARVSREPRLKNYYDAAESSGGEIPQFNIDNNGNFDFNSPLVKPETMNALELGTSLIFSKLVFTANYYFMFFENEIVKNGQLDRFGQPKTGNADETIHTGLELSSNFKFLDELEILFNFTYSKNLIKKASYFKNYKNGLVKINLADNPVSGFPDYLGNLAIKFNLNNFYSRLDFKYVGSYFSDNFGEKLPQILQKYPDILDYSDNKVDSYFITNFSILYKFVNFLYLKELTLSLQIFNLFNQLYATTAYGKEFFPGAERNFVFNLQINL